MTREEQGKTSLASDLDQTDWDYQPRKDRRLLLAPLARLLGSVVWEFRPKHLGPAPVQDESDLEAETIEEVETAPSESADRPNRRR